MAVLQESAPVSVTDENLLGLILFRLVSITWIMEHYCDASSILSCLTVFWDKVSDTTMSGLNSGAQPRLRRSAGWTGFRPKKNNRLDWFREGRHSFGRAIDAGRECIRLP